MTRVASMSMTSQPARVFPAIFSDGNPAGVPSIRSHTCARAFALARAILSSAAAVPARSRARRTVGPLGASPNTGARCASRAMSLMLVAPSAIAAASETSTVPRSKTGEVPFFRSAPLSCPVLAATLSAHCSAAFDVHVLAGLGCDAVEVAGSGFAVVVAGEEAGERVDDVE